MRTFLFLILGLSIFFSACTDDPAAPEQEESSPYKVVYLAHRQTNQGIQSQVHIADLDGSDDTLVFTSDTLFQTIAWVGNFFYLGTSESSKGVVYYVRYDGQDFSRYVEADVVPSNDMKFSYNSKYLFTEDETKISIVDISDFTLVTYTGQNAVWHPSQSKLFFDRLQGEHSQVVQLNVSENKFTTLSLPSENAISPAISPNAEMIAYGVNNSSSSLVITATQDGNNQDMKASVDYPIERTLWNPSDPDMPMFITQGGEFAVASEFVLWKTSPSGPMPLHKFKGFENEFVWHPEKDILFFVEIQEDDSRAIGTYNLEKNTPGLWNYNPELEIMDFFITYGR